MKWVVQVTSVLAVLIANPNHHGAPISVQPRIEAFSNGQIVGQDAELGGTPPFVTEMRFPSILTSMERQHCT
jgi:hypothetical protein